LPSALSPAEIDLCRRVIARGCAVNPKLVAMELPLAKSVAVARDGLEIVGVGAIKRDWPEYAEGIAKRSGFRFDPSASELGYIAVRASHRGRGISKVLVASLLAAMPRRPVFATTAEERMKATLTKAGFVQRGGEWLGKKGELSLWVLS
jgi:GNAT superfamily N-acetyltransferase